MKTISLFDVTFNTPIMKTSSLLLIGALVLAGTGVCVQAAEDSSSSVTEIEHASGLYQSLVWVGDTPPSEAENEALAADLQETKAYGLGGGALGLEQFVAAYPNSPWAASLEANLGRYYMAHDRFGDAIKSWKSAWAATQAAKDGPAKQVADATFMQLGKLLVGLGKVDELKQLLDQTSGRSFGRGAAIQTVRQLRSDYETMSQATDASFRCGIYAVNKVGIKLVGTNFDRMLMLKAPAPSTGFS